MTATAGCLAWIRVYGAPETFLIDGQGIIRRRHAGDLNERVWREELQPLGINTTGGRADREV